MHSPDALQNYSSLKPDRQRACCCCCSTRLAESMERRFPLLGAPGSISGRMMCGISPRAPAGSTTNQPTVCVTRSSGATKCASCT